MEVELIASITRFPNVGGDLEPFFDGKDQDKNLAARMKKKYGLDSDKRGFNITSINDQDIEFTMKVLSMNLIRNMQLNQCTVGVITVAY